MKFIFFCLVNFTVLNAQASEIPAIHSISNEDNGSANSHYVTLTIHFVDARIPVETVTISRKDMDSDSNIEYVIQKLEKRFKKEQLQKELDQFDKPYYPDRSHLKGGNE